MNKTQKDISVIITTYGHPQFLKRAIESVLNQTCRNWELIIVDDNNPNTKERIETELVINEFLSKIPTIKYLKHEFNKNGAAARNTGIRASNGKYIAFLDDDDEYAPTRLEKSLTAIQKVSEQYAGVYSGCTFIKRNGKCKKVYAKAPSGNFLYETLCCTFLFYSGSNIFVKREVFDQIGLFDERFIRHQDYEFLVRFFCKYDLYGIPEPLLIKYEIGSNIPNYKKLESTKKMYLDKFSDDIAKLDQKKQSCIFYSNYMQLYFSTPRKEKSDKRLFLTQAMHYHVIKPFDLVKMLLKGIKHD